MKAIYLLLVFTSILLFAVSCAKDAQELPADEEQGYISLQLSNTTLATRAGEEAGEDDLNENQIQTIDCFFYPNGKTNEDAVYLLTEVDVRANRTATIRLKMPVEKKRALFGNGSTCQVYVIANRPQETVIGTQTSIRALKGLKIVEENFGTGANGGVQEAFVMDGSQTVTLSADGKSATGDVPLYRAASKIRLVVSAKENIVDEEGATWHSHPEDMYILLQKGVKRSHIDAVTVPYLPAEEDYFTFAGDSEDVRYFSRLQDSTPTRYTHVPFYSYTSAWASNFDTHKALVTLVIPWKKEGEQFYRKCYYKVMINETGMKLARNTYYKINLSVGVLGSFVPESDVQLNPSYIVLNWGSNTVNAEMQDLRYLVVDYTAIELKNQHSVSIPYASSHESEIVGVTVSRPDVSQELSPRVILINNQTRADNVYRDGIDNNRPYTFSLSNNRITFSHELKNKVGDDDTSNYDYTPNLITFTIRHKDNPNYLERISITQHPMMSIEANINSDYSNGGDVNGNRGFTMVNNGSHTTGYSNYSQYTLGSANGLTGGNKNPNMYVITTTALQGVTAYTIGDPRSKRIDNLSIDIVNYSWGRYSLSTVSDWSVSASHTKGSGSRRLSYYYPAEETSRTENMIAPIFRTASSYGATNAIIRKNAKARCASYQEDGLPAGRWRLPTNAEVKYIVSLSAQGKIPRLFGSATGSTDYWTANGLVRVSGNSVSTHSTTSGSAFVRCVYDEWFWGSQRIGNRSIFTWGDSQ